MAKFPSSWGVLSPKTWKNRGYLAGQGKPSPRNDPGRFPTLLAIHGFGGTPREVDLLADEAQRLGLRVRAPLLPGHGTHVRDLGRTSFEDWVAAARSELDRCLAEGEVIVAGLSLGATIAARLAADVKSLKALCLLGNALWLNAPYPALWLSLVEHLRVPKFFWVPKLAPDIEDPEKRLEHLGYDAQLVAAAVEVYKGGRDTRLRLREITCPTLLMHGALDKVCPVANLARAAGLLGSTDIRRVILEHSGHIITRDVDASVVANEFGSFLTEVISR